MSYVMTALYSACVFSMINCNLCVWFSFVLCNTISTYLTMHRTGVYNERV